MRRCFRPLWSKVRYKTNLVSIGMVGSGVEEDDQVTSLRSSRFVGVVGGGGVTSATWSSEGGVS